MKYGSVLFMMSLLFCGSPFAQSAELLRVSSQLQKLVMKINNSCDTDPLLMQQYLALERVHSNTYDLGFSFHKEQSGGNGFIAAPDVMGTATQYLFKTSTGYVSTNTRPHALLHIQSGMNSSGEHYISLSMEVIKQVEALIPVERANPGSLFWNNGPQVLASLGNQYVVQEEYGARWTFFLNMRRPESNAITEIVTHFVASAGCSSDSISTAASQLISNYDSLIPTVATSWGYGSEEPVIKGFQQKPYYIGQQRLTTQNLPKIIQSMQAFAADMLNDPTMPITPLRDGLAPLTYSTGL